MHLGDFRENLLNREHVLSLVEQYSEVYNPDIPLGDVPKEMEYIKEDFRRINAFRKAYWKNNAKLIFHYAESPIEKIFLNGFNLSCITNRSPFVVFTPPYKSINKELDALRKNYDTFFNAYNEFYKLTGEEEPEAFLYAIEQMNISEDKKRIARYIIRIHRSIHSEFHLSIQSTFDDITLGGKCIRPDIFVWIPSKPSFKLVIECDGYKYHSNKQSFSDDRARDRLLQDKGCQVLRFSGSEITNNFIGVAQELRDYLHSRELELFN